MPSYTITLLHNFKYFYSVNHVNVFDDNITVVIDIGSGYNCPSVGLSAVLKQGKRDQSIGTRPLIELGQIYFQAALSFIMWDNQI